MEALRRPLFEARVVHPERRQDPFAEDSLERPALPLPHQRAERIETGVRIDPPRPGRRKGGLTLEREPRRVSEQMTDRRSRRTGSLVEVEQAAIGRDQHGPRRRELGHRRPAEAMPCLATTREDSRRPDHHGRRVVGTPRVDRGQDVVEVAHRAKRTGARRDRDVWRGSAGPTG